MLSIDEIKRFIEEDQNSEQKTLANIGQRYYEAKHDILNYRMFYYNDDGKLVEDKFRTNVKISHPFFMILSEQLAAYMLSFTNNPIRATENAEGLQTHLDTYFDAQFWAEAGVLCSGAYNKGFEYMYGYKNHQDRLAFACADSLGVVEVSAKHSADGKPHTIRRYIDKELTKDGMKNVTKIEVWNDEGVWFFVQDSDTAEIKRDESVEFNPRPHVVYTNKKTGKKQGKLFNFIPFWRLDNNKNQFSGIKPIKEHIDDYDIHACSLSNNLVDFDTPLHLIKGYKGDNLDKLQQNLKTKKLISVGNEGGLEVKTVDIPYEARKMKLEIDKENIFMFGMGFNPTQVGDGNITNIVIKSRYSLLELKAKKLTDRLCAVLDNIIEVVLAEINEKNGTDYAREDIYYEFKRSTLTNDSENIANAKIEAETKQVEINTILNAATVIGDEKTVQLICESFDIDYKEIKEQLEKSKLDSVENAKKTLEETVIDDEGDL